MVASALLCALLSWPADAALPRGTRDLSLETQAALRGLEREAQEELFTLFRRYNDTVARRVEEGWFSGLLSDDLVARPEDNHLPARQIEEALAKRERELKALLRELEAVRGRVGENAARQRVAAKRKEVSEWRSASKRAKGLCIDWSDAVWADLIKARAEQWDIRDRRRSRRPFHTAAVACAPADEPTVCLVFDPWESGRADVYPLADWDEGSFQTRLPGEFFIHELPEPKRKR